MLSDMEGRDTVLAGVSAAQLGFGLAGLALAVRRRHPYDIPLLRGRADAVGRDALTVGTALSAPSPMLVTQAVLTAKTAATASPRAARGLGLLGVAMTGGYLVERHVRRRLRCWDSVETPVVAGGLALSAAMGVLGLRRR